MSTLSSTTFATGRVLRRRYRLEKPLIIGSSPELWLGEDLVLQRPVRIKLLHADLARDETFSSRLRSEALAAARLSHPHIVPTYDTGQEEETTFIVLGEVDGRTLTEILASGPLEPLAAITIVRQVCEALDYAHDKGVVHGDVNPDNIVVVGGDHRVVLSDFGIAKAVAETLDDAIGESHDAKPHNKYTSGEQLEGKPATAQSDIWSAGVLLREMTSHQDCEPFDKSRLGAILERATDSNPEARYFRASDMAQELRLIERPSTSRYLDENWPNQRVEHHGEVDAPDADATVSNKRILLPPPVAPQSQTSAPANSGPETSRPNDETAQHDVADETNPAGRWATAENPVVTSDHDPQEHQETQSHSALNPTAAPFEDAPAPAKKTGGLNTSSRTREEIERARERKLTRRNAAITVALTAIIAAILLGRALAGSDSATTPTATTQPVNQVTLASARTFDPPPGDGDENGAQADNVLDDNPETFWSTQTYRSPTFGNLKKGVGLVLRTSRPAQLSSLELQTKNRGWSARIYVANSPATSLASWGTPVDTQSGLGSTARFDLHNSQGSAIMIWFTDMGDSNRMSVVEASINNN